MKILMFFSILIILVTCLSCSTKEISGGRCSENFTERNIESFIEAYSLFVQSGVFHLSSYRIRDDIEQKNIDALLIQQLRIFLEGHQVKIDQLNSDDGIEEKHLLAMIMADRNHISLEFKVEESDELRNEKLKIFVEKLQKKLEGQPESTAE